MSERTRRSPSCGSSVSLIALRTTSSLGLQLRVVLPDEGPDVFGEIKQLGPLLLVQGHREATQTVDRDAALLAHLERDAPTAARLQRLILRAQTRHLVLEPLVALLVGHRLPRY